MIISSHISFHEWSYIWIKYLSDYHFIKMLDRPVDLPMRFIIVCVAEPLTLKKRNTKLDTVMAQSWHLARRWSTILRWQTILLMSWMLSENEYHFQCFYSSVPTPVAEVGWDNEKVGRVCQVFAEQLPIFLFLGLTQGAHKHRNDAKLVFVAATSDYWINNLSTITAPHWQYSVQWAWVEIKSALIQFYFPQSIHQKLMGNCQPTMW